MVALFDKLAGSGCSGPLMGLGLLLLVWLCWRQYRDRDRRRCYRQRERARREYWGWT